MSFHVSPGPGRLLCFEICSCFGGANKESWSTSDEGDDCFWCRCSLVGKLMRTVGGQAASVCRILQASHTDIHPC